MNTRPAGMIRAQALGTAFLALALLLSFVDRALGSDEFDRFALQSASASLSSPQAGEHADLTLSFELTSDEEGVPFARARDIEFQLPPGVIGNPQGVPRCTVAQLGEIPADSECPIDSQIGATEVTVRGSLLSGSFTEPIYNMSPPTGSDIVARFGFMAGAYPTFVNVRVDPIDFGIVATVEGASSAALLLKATSTVWGVPAASTHDAFRITPLEARDGTGPPEGRKSNLPPAPFLSNPTDCSLQRQVTVTARSYQLPDQPSTETVPFPQILGCGTLNFEPTFTAVPTNPEAAAPTGFEAELTIPQDETAAGRATSTMRSARVTLPEGLTINPAAGAGLAACSAEQVAYGTSDRPHCPDAAKIGYVEIEVPALEDTLRGAVYQRTPEPGNLFRFWVVTDEQGVRLKLPAQIELNPVTGQVTTVFNGIDALGGLPQVPFSNLKLHVYGGSRAPLATPSTCGTYQTHYSFTPWSGRPAVEGDTAMQINQGCGKGGFSPQIEAGTVNPRAGAFSPFTFALTRRDGEANPQSFDVHLPLGLVAKLAGVPLCPETQAAAGTCGAGSMIGHLAAAAGVGDDPLWIPQPGKAPTAIYLAGPYKGAPYSIVAVVPAQAGPFDLGLVVSRAGIYIDPESALVTLKTDPLPQILEGVPVSYREIHAIVDRPEFMLNPTSCDPKRITATVTAANGAVANPSTGFQATNCATLPYSPKLKLSFQGSTTRSGNPGIKAVLTQKPNQANTKAVTAILPPSQFIDNSHINNPCTRVQFAAEACPAGSVLGTVKAWTPLLDQPLTGNVYFRSNGGDRELPDIVADLRGPIRFTLVGFVDSVRRKGSSDSRVRTRFLSAPDAPVSRFEMKLFGGKRGLIENSQDLCVGKRRLELRMRAHNGVILQSKPVLRVPCK